ncbi:NrfD/PsrC family molybdoenzyme membrane anchor subunit [Thermus thermamylovorans]|uniref:Polysulfide reductase n=1 Tax=Thermus thermamylovorans TaxID=2509362 RepID=A0A4Q9B7E2_9DEIN|nr:NrfD/PsrC family molybdoenzyme membrane anchor subunit [Thermus thermamylovorans]TBH21032.1 hypothetical protein ETP66_04450 [Thermus thermamylovorans]
MPPSLLTLQIGIYYPNPLGVHADWPFWITLYFWLAGAGVGAFVLAAMMVRRGLLAPESLRKPALLAFAVLALGGAILTIDLGQPLRFANMFLGGTTHNLATGLSSVTWVGAVLLLLAVPLLLLGLWRLAFLRRFYGLLAVLLLLLGLYPGVLLYGSMNKPFWSATPLMPFIFLASVFATGAAALYLLGVRRESLTALALRFSLLTLLLLGLHLLWVYPVARASVNAALMGSLAWAFWGFVLLGLALPMALLRRRGRLALAPGLVLAGGLLLRHVVLMSGQI